MQRILSALSLSCSLSLTAATLEKLSIDEMSVKSTAIVRGRVSGCTGEARGSMIHTRCRVDVSERWKGATPSQLDFFVPGGTAGGLTQTFTGTPKFDAGREYVLFLWAGRSGVFQIIGLSQGAFDVRSGGKSPLVNRAASTEPMFNAAGQPVTDEGIQMSVSALHARVDRALGGSAK